jgi:PP-loop superfamily ATP-utilizing enzyme
VRLHGDLARVELPQTEVGHWLSPSAAARMREAVIGAGFARVAVDARGFRSGSLNVLGGVVSDAPLQSAAPNERDADSEASAA